MLQIYFSGLDPTQLYGLDLAQTRKVTGLT
jgi:hypothetical protein